MKISSDQMSAAVNQFKSGPVDKNESSSSAGREKGIERSGDRVALSDLGTELERLKKTLLGLPDASGERVARLKAEIASGSYHVDGRAVAEKMVKGWMELRGL